MPTDAWNFHPQAIRAYNERAEALLRRLDAQDPLQRRAEGSAKPPEPNSAGTDAPIVAHYGDEHTVPGSIRQQEVDYRGRTRSCYFETVLRGLVGLREEAYDELAALASRIARDSTWKGAVSPEFVEARLIDWLQARVDGAATDALEFVGNAAAQAVDAFEVWLPIPTFHIGRPFEVGKVTFRRITEGMMDEYRKTYPSTNRPEVEYYFQSLRSKVQAITAACVAVRAEPIRAHEIALSEAGPAIALVRILCPALLNVYKWTAADPAFVDALGGSLVFHVRDRKILTQTEAMPENLLDQWVVPAEEVERHFVDAWAYAHELLVAQRTPFQELLLGALVHYTKSALKSEFSERLLYVISAIESVFIRDPRENILQNLRDRLAIIIGTTVEQRRDVSEVIAAVYEKRSSFVHRGLHVGDVAPFEDFFIAVWSVMLKLLQNHRKWRTKDEFLAFIDNQKFAGPPFATEHLPDVV